MNQPTIIDERDDGAIAAWVHARLAEALADTDAPIAIAVPGGSTPFPILAAVAALPIAWDRVTVWPTDDRVVPEDHPASNAGCIRALLAPVGAEVVALSEMEQVPHFALVWLGMGADGHIASLFPSADPHIDDPEPVRRLTPDPLPPDAPFARVTLTLPALLAAEAIVFVIRGVDKRAVFAAAARGETDTPVARLLAAARAPVTCFT